MNLLAGILIGILTPNWTTRIIIPFFWALIFVGYRWIRTKVKFDIKIIIVEYATAVITSLLLALLLGSVFELISSIF